MDRLGAAVVARDDRGFVLLAVLVIVAMAALAAAVTVSLARDTVAISASDCEGIAADAAARAGLAAAADSLRWALAPPAACFAFNGALGDRQRYSVVTEPEVTPTGTGERWYRLSVEGSSGQARRLVTARIALRPSPFAGVCTCAGDFSAESAATLTGSGLCAGGDVRGREHISLSPGADQAFARLWPVNGVHAAGSIYANGVEVHENSQSSQTDTDRHGGVIPPADLTRGPDVADLGALRARRAPPGEALDAGVLWLDRLPVAPPDGGDALVIVIRETASRGPLLVRGTRPDSACGVTVVVEGDARIEGSAEGVALRGGLVVCGALAVDSPFRLVGCLWAREVVVRAPFSVALPATWPNEVPAGFSQCSVLALER